MAGTIYNLIPGGYVKKGAVWTTEKKAVVRGFTVEFVVKAFTNPAVGDPTDGFSFVVQNDSPTPPLQEGGFMGYSSINNCLAVEFDGISNPHTNDIASDHVAVMPSRLGANAIHDVAIDLAVVGIAELDDRTVTVEIVYDAAAKTLSAPGISLTDFDIEDYVTLDDGRAWIGVVATSGEFNFAGPTELHSWSATFPSGCGETSDWLEPFFWNATLNYQGDKFDHEILDPSVRVGDTVEETKTVIGDDMGGLTGDEIEELETGPFPLTWMVEADIKHGRNGIWRNDNDTHAFFPPAFPTIVAWLADNDVGSITMKQVMTHVPSGRVYMKHKITLKIIAIRENDPCGYSTGAVGHVVVDKSGAHNPDVYPAIPNIPCKP